MKKIIELKSVSYTYPDGNNALNEINLSVNKGESLCIIGPNGAGKSTLLLSILGFIPFEGSIKINGISVKKENLKQIRKKAGIVFQDPDDQLFMPTVIEDIMFGAKNSFSDGEAKLSAREALEIVGLEGFEKRLAHHLSFGEKKRVAIAGVLAMKPSIILLDEPTSNLDHYHRRSLLNTLKKLHQTSITATHDLAYAAEIASRIIILSEGKVIAKGDTYQILSNKKLLKSVHLEPPCDCILSELVSLQK